VGICRADAGATNGPVKQSEGERMTMEAERIDQPTRALFSIYFAEDTDAATASIYQFRARLAHICDGFPVPADLAALAASAINAFAFMTERLRPVELQITDDEEIPF
jgi:hypothetical protein